MKWEWLVIVASLVFLVVVAVGGLFHHHDQFKKCQERGGVYKGGTCFSPEALK